MIINFIETNGRTCAGMTISENDLLDYIQYGDGNCNITLCTDNETVTFMKRDNVWFVLVGR